MSTKTKSIRKAPHTVIPPRGLRPQGRLALPSQENEATMSVDRLSDAAPVASGSVHDFGQIRVHPDQNNSTRSTCQARSTAVQAKLTIGQPNDRYEQEADRVAEQVLCMPGPPLLRQRENLEDELLQLTSIQDDTRLEDQIRSMQGGGETLREASRRFFEPRFGINLQDVRIHTDEKAAQAAQNINARAFTVGRDIFFSKGTYSPDDFSGRKLLAHELTHVVQQGLAGQQSPQKAEPGNRFVQCLQLNRKGEVGRTRVAHEGSKVFWLITALKHVGVKVTRTHDSGGTETSYIISPTPFGELQVTESNLYQELVDLAFYWKIRPPWLFREPGEYVPPYWLNKEALDFWNRALRHELAADGDYTERFGRSIQLLFTTLLIDEKYNTREQVIWVRVINGRTRIIQAFQYKSTERYMDDLLMLRAAEEINYLMYHYVEKKNLSPEQARERIEIEAAEALKLTLILFAQAFVSP